ncbi:MAG: leucine-rich repeat domain-containing protein, partial [Bacteroidales bacterium]|nr:leucine-rich repeat domain-containing protein [Bacteroidales bacterium]
EYAFSGCESITSVIIPDSDIVIGEDAFSRCDSLIEIHNRCTTPQKIDTPVFEDLEKQLCTLYVPASAVDLYKSAPEWKEFKNIVGKEA